MQSAIQAAAVPPLSIYTFHSPGVRRQGTWPSTALLFGWLGILSSSVHLDCTPGSVMVNLNNNQLDGKDHTNYSTGIITRSMQVLKHSKVSINMCN